MGSCRCGRPWTSTWRRCPSSTCCCSWWACLSTRRCLIAWRTATMARCVNFSGRRLRSRTQCLWWLKVGRARVSSTPNPIKLRSIPSFPYYQPEVRCRMFCILIFSGVRLDLRRHNYRSLPSRPLPSQNACLVCHHNYFPDLYAFSDLWSLTFWVGWLTRLSMLPIFLKPLLANIPNYRKIYEQNA